MNLTTDSDPKRTLVDPRIDRTVLCFIVSLRWVDLVHKGNTMFTRNFSAILLIILALFLVSSLGVTTAYGAADTEEAFRVKTHEIAKAFARNDIEFLSGVYTDNFLMTAQSLHVVTKKQLLDNQRFEDGTTFEIDDWRMIRSGDTVVVMYKQTWNYNDGGANEAQFTNVWVKEGGEWLILSTHATQISLK